MNIGYAMVRKLIDFMRSIFSAPAPLVPSVWLVIAAPGARTIGKRLKTAMTHSPDSGYARTIRELDARILRDHVRIYLLDHDSLDLPPASIDPAKADS